MVIFSFICLKEKISPKIWIAVFIGFIGELTVIEPGLSIFDLKSLIPLTVGFFLGLYQIVKRKVFVNDKNETSLFYSGGLLEYL